MTKQLTALLATGLLVTACGGGGNGGREQPPPETRTYAATLTAIEVQRSADQQALGVDGLPAEGATIRVTAD